MAALLLEEHYLMISIELHGGFVSDGTASYDGRLVVLRALSVSAPVRRAGQGVEPVYNGHLQVVDLVSKGHAHSYACIRAGSEKGNERNLCVACRLCLVEVHLYKDRRVLRLGENDVGKFGVV